MTDDDRDILILALTAYAEARSEGDEGIRAQIHSVLNRYAAHEWDAGHTIAGTCLRAYAYSAWNTTDPNRVTACSDSMTNSVMLACLQEAEDAILGKTVDPTDGATHYYAQGSAEPDWVSGINKATGQRVAPPAVFTCQIGRHLFYKDVA